MSIVQVITTQTEFLVPTRRSRGSLRRADVILLDPHQAGGLHRCRKDAAIAEAANIPVTLHSGAELGFSTATYLHLAAALPNLMLAVDNKQSNLKY